MILERSGPYTVGATLTAQQLQTQVVTAWVLQNTYASLATALDVLDVAPNAVAAFEEQLRAEAFALLYRHRQQFGALVAALLAHQVLNPAEICTVWRQGAFDFRGRVGAIPHYLGPEDLADPPFRRILRERFGCTFADSGPQNHALGDRGGNAA